MKYICVKKHFDGVKICSAGDEAVSDTLLNPEFWLQEVETAENKYEQISIEFKEPTAAAEAENNDNVQLTIDNLQLKDESVGAPSDRPLPEENTTPTGTGVVENTTPPLRGTPPQRGITSPEGDDNVQLTIDNAQLKDKRHKTKTNANAGF